MNEQWWFIIVFGSLILLWIIGSFIELYLKWKNYFRKEFKHKNIWETWRYLRSVDHDDHGAH